MVLSPSVPAPHGYWHCLTASGTISQANGDYFGDYANAICTGCAFVSILRGITDRSPFTTADVDDVLIQGNLLYRNLRSLYNIPASELYLDAEDHCPPQVTFRGVTYNVSSQMCRHGIFGDLPMPKYLAKTNIREVQLLQESLLEAFETGEGAGYIFTGRYKTISFWPAEDGYFLFDSHQIDGNRCYTEHGGLARVFKCADVATLAFMLHGDYPNYSRAAPQRWGIYAVNVSLPDGHSLPALRGPSVAPREQRPPEVDSRSQPNSDDEQEWDRPAPHEDISSVSQLDISLGDAASGVQPHPDSLPQPLSTSICPSTTDTAQSVAKRGRGRPRKRGRGGRGGRASGGRSTPSVPEKSLIITSTPRSSQTQSSQTDEAIPTSRPTTRGRPSKRARVTATSPPVAQLSQINLTQEYPTTSHEAPTQEILDILNSSYTTRYTDESDMLSIVSSHESVASDGSSEFLTADSAPVSENESVSSMRESQAPAKKRGRPRKRKRFGGRRALTDEEKQARMLIKHAKHNAMRRDSHLSQMRNTSAELYSRSPERQRAARRETTAAARERSPERVAAYHAAYEQAHPESEAERQRISNARHAEERAARDRANRETRNARRRIARAVPPALRSRTCIGNTPWAELDCIEPFALQTSSLSDCSTCNHCQAPLFEEEKSAVRWCCGSGDFIPPRLPPLEADFYSSEEYLSQSRQYNSLFSFAALGCSGVVPTYHDRRAFVSVHGRVYSRVFSLDSPHRQNNLVMYINDMQMGVERPECETMDREVLADVSSYLNDVNPFLPQLRRLNEHASETAYIHFQQTSRATHGNVLGDVPMADEIAAIIDMSEDLEPRTVVIWKAGQRQPQYLSHHHCAYEALQYPLLFPHGNAGWNFRMVGPTGKKITLMRYIRSNLLAEPRFTNQRRLSQEWLVDLYCRVEEDRLYWIRTHQADLRTAERREIQLLLEGRQGRADDPDDPQIGRDRVQQDIREDETIAAEGGAAMQAGRVYLPSSVVQSPRYMRIKYQNAMAAVAKFGKPTYFITLTCNPHWKEIQESLRPGEKASDRPDVCVRVFKLKFALFKKLLESGVIFGEIEYYTYVIEYQKRGGVHAHLAIRVRGGGPVLPDEIDRFICATIPPVGTPGNLRELIIKFQLHGACGPHRPWAPCMDKDSNTCSKHFPKKVCQSTHVDDFGFTHYKRPCEESVVVRGRGEPANDSWVVPTNPAVLIFWDAHNCCEIASDKLCVKYLFKYITKGPDRTLAAVAGELRPESDEVLNYINSRYIGAAEAAWRSFGYDNMHQYPTVHALVVHLPIRGRIIHRAGAEQEALQDVSELELYFARPEPLHHLRYVELYERFNRGTEPKKTLLSYGPLLRHCYLTERREPQICRMHWVSPSLGETFYLRMLLTTLPATSYEELRTVDGSLYETFQEACEARHMLDNDREWAKAMREAATFKTGRALRSLFVGMVLNGAPGGLLWEEFSVSLTEDFLHRNPLHPLVAKNLALLALSRMLSRHGKTLLDFGILEEPIEDSTEVTRERLRWNVEEQLAYHDEWAPRLQDEQLAAYQQLSEAMQRPAAERRGASLFFIDGPAGSGKSVLLRTLTAKWRAQNKVVVCVASTGIAALMFEGGTTAHSAFRIPVDPDSGSLVCSMDAGSERADLLRAANAIIWDEAPMANSRDVQAANRLLKDLTMNSEHFGGKIVIFSGDFRQIPPVMPRAGLGDIINAGLRRLPLWQDVTVIPLTASRRAQDPQFANFLMSIGNGSAETFQLGDDPKRVTPLPNVQHCLTMDGLIKFVYPEEVLADPDQCSTRAILSGTNANIAEINRQVLSLLPGEQVNLRSVDTMAAEGFDLVTDPTFLSTLSASGVPDSLLSLKVGCVVMLLRNMNFEDGLVNGTKLIVTKITPLVIHCRKPGSNETVFIPRIPFKFKVGERGMEVCRKQFPLRLSYAMTINKSQSQTLTKVGFDLRADVFSHGQLYVGLGRVRSADDLMVLVLDHRVDLDGVAYAFNLVYQQLL